VVPPIVTSAIFEMSVPRQPTDYIYSRIANPTRDVLEKCLASLDNAKYAFAYNSGIAAITTIISTLSAGDGIIASKHFYSGTLDSMNIAQRMGFDVQFVDFTDLNNLKNALKPNTKLVWSEACMNPTLKVVDIKATADIVHQNSSAILVVDNTFLSPYYLRPLELGADIAMYSLTKYFCGHSDVIGGSIAFNDDSLKEKFKFATYATGTQMQPFDAYLINRSLKTLSLRLNRHFENGYKIAKWLENHSKIEKVNHPALKSHEGHEIALRQSYGHSGIFSFYIKEKSNEKINKFFAALKLIPVATSLGGVETTIALPRETSHFYYTDEEAAAMDVTRNLIRLSVGIEDVEDIIKAIGDALNVI
jgi:cystathionine gamma-lyase